MANSDANRTGKFHSTLASDRLLLKRFVGHEYVNDLFDFRVEVIDQDANLDFDTLLGKLGTVELSTLDGNGRFYNGVITEIDYLGTDDRMTVYGLRMQPWLWLLSLSENNRIWHEKSVEEILDDVFTVCGQKQVQKKLTKTYPKIHYTVQFGESDLHFVMRMLERHGINIHFKHENGKHTLVLSDDTSEFEDISGNTRKYIPVGQGHAAEEEHIWQWSAGRKVTTGKVKLVDYNHATPNSNMTATANASLGHSEGNYEAYRYPGGHLTASEGTKIATLRSEQIQSADNHHRAVGDLITCQAGMVVKPLGDHPDDIENKEYVCLRATHTFVNNSYDTGGGGVVAAYSGEYTFYPVTEPLAPEIRTRPTLIEGPQTAKVVGAQGTEIDCDALGRILVKFHWDLTGAHSMRVRCAQMWAHNKWGSMFIPRVGMEVVVMFINGDPEDPLVVGCVYNDANKPPWDLPNDKNIAGIKSRSTTNGGADNYNEIYFDDTKGEELFNQQAERDMKTLVKRNERRDVWVDRTKTVGQHQAEWVKGHYALTVGDDSMPEIGAGSLGNDGSFEILTTNLFNVVSYDETWLQTTGKRWDATGGDQEETVDGKKDVTVNKDLTIESKKKITLKVGSSSIVMDGKSITIKSTKIDVKATAALSTKGLTVKHEATANMTIKGKMIMIN
ncbi:MAG: type VI secretion system tip protein TssI/VgrG [Pseudomonadota bacterium]